MCYDKKIKFYDLLYFKCKALKITTVVVVLLTQENLFRTLHKFHDDQNRLPLSGDTDEPYDVGVGVLLKDPPLCQQSLRLLLCKRFVTSFDSYSISHGFVNSLVYVTKIALNKKKQILLSK